MRIQEDGVLATSVRYFFTPSSFAERVLLYPTRLGHYYCDQHYKFSSASDIARQASHKLHYMIMFIKRGRLSFNIENSSYIAESGGLVLFDCKQEHQYAALTDDVEFYWLVSNGLPFDRLYEEIRALHGGRHVFGVAEPGLVQTLLLRLLEVGKAGRTDAEHSCSELIYALLCQLLTAESDAGDEIGVLLKRSRRYMDSNFAAAVSVESVAAHVGLSASYFTKRFRTYTGYSPYEYLTLRRIGRAKEILLSSDKTIKQIAFETGYNSEENFIRAFKKKTGLSPSMFRKYPV